MAEYFILVGDVGGTNLRYALYRSREEGDVLVKAESFLSEDFRKKGVVEVGGEDGEKNVVCSIREFLVGQPKPDLVVLCVSGVVKGNRVVASCAFGDYLTDTLISETLNISEVYILNDIQGAGYGLLTLKEDEDIEINGGVKDHNGPIVCMSIGTGIGMCYMTKSGHNYSVHCTEGGFTDMSPKCEEDLELCLYLKNKTNILNFAHSRFISGGKIHNIYEWLREKYPELKNQEFDEEFKRSHRMKAKLLLESGYGERDELAKRTTQIWERIIGYFIGNLFVNFIPSGGIYIIGGVISKNFAYLSPPQYILEGFYKGVDKILHDEMRRIPIYIVKPEELGIRGTLYFARQLKFS